MNELQVDIIAGRVRDGAIIIDLRPREWELLCAIVLPGRPVPRAELAGVLRPDADELAALNLVDVRIHRLRARIGAAAVEWTPWGYRLAATAAVDLHECEALVRELRPSRCLTPDQLQRCRAAYDALAASRMPESFRQITFSTTLERRRDVVLRELEERLAHNALATGQPHHALSIAERVLERDYCDEGAWDIAIRAHVALGDRGSAMREYRRYAQALADELDLPPSPQLHALIRNAVAAAV